MRKGLLSAVVVMTVVFFATSAFALPPWAKDMKFEFGGYVKLDYINQNANLSSVSSPVTTANQNQDENIITARQTRLHVIISGPEVLGATPSAFIEGDFYKPSDSGPAFSDTSSPGFRLRHAEFNLNWKKQGTQLMFGQFWDIFAPFAASTLDFDTGGFEGAPNNPRIAQIRVTQKVKLNEHNSLTFIAGLEDPQQDPVEPQANADAKALYAGQVMFNSDLLGKSPGYWGLPMVPLTANVFGIYGRRKTDNHNTNPWGAGIYVHVPILHSSDGHSRANTLSIEGQTFLSAGLNYGGMHANQYGTIGTGSHLEAAPGYGAIAQIIYYPIHPLGITVGYGRRGIRDTQEYRDLDNAVTIAGPHDGGHIMAYNDYIWSNITYDIKNVRFGIEYAHFKTKYVDFKGSPNANRFQFSAIYFF